jgi:methylglyoxal synthase
VNIGLAASSSLRQGARSPLIRLLKRNAPVLKAATIYAVGGTWDAIRRARFSGSHPSLHRLPRGFEGGLMSLVAQVVAPEPELALDCVIYLIDPNDPTSVFPEAQALKRQCVVHGKPFLSTLAGADEWLALCAGRSPRAELYLKQTVALVAHDRHKRAMVAFAGKHFALLSRFQARVATGTTGGLLNAMARKRGVRDWVAPMLSGPLGGDAQIARLLLEGKCDRVIFFEDPHVAREHEADIQLLERAARVVGERAICINDPVTAGRWARST